MREQELAASEGILASSGPSLVILVEPEFDTSIPNPIFLDLVGQPQSWCCGAAGLTATGRCHWHRGGCNKLTQLAQAVQERHHTIIKATMKPRQIQWEVTGRKEIQWSDFGGATFIDSHSGRLRRILQLVNP
jgi:hypothetical protein